MKLCMRLTPFTINNTNNIKQGKPSGMSFTLRFQLQTFIHAEQSQHHNSTDVE